MSAISHTLLFGLLAVLLFSCRKDEQFTDDPGAMLVLTEDTVLFDTIFTTVGSVTKRFTVRNENASAVKVDIALEGGTPSPFRVNVDGASGTAFSDVEILGGDSIYIFVEATLNANNANNPFIIEDHILLNTNGNEQNVLLLAWGQDAHFFYPTNNGGGFPDYSIIPCGDHWVNDKPYVIYGYAVVDSLCTLTIDPGVKVYFHGGGGLWVYKYGRIEALGTVEDHITFQGDRLEAQYADLPNQWDRIWINEGSLDNEMRNCVIKNALIGLQAQTFPLTPGQPTSTNKLILENVNIQNCLTAGLYAENYRIDATNLLLGSAGQYSMVLTGGGQYKFDQSTIANYWSFDVRQDPAFLLSNRFLDITGTTQVRSIATSSFTNCIVNGNNTNEFKLDVDEAAGPLFTFSNCLLRTDQPTNNDNGHFPDQGVIFRNLDPGFVAPSDGDFHLRATSLAKGKASTPAPNALLDLDGRDRPNFSDGSDGFLPDLGCFEQYD